MATNIKLTKEDLKSRFDEYNKLYFGGKLGKCEFHVYKSSISGYGKFNTKKSPKGKITYSIWITNNCEWTEKTLKETIIHEMIHYYVYAVENVHCDGLLGHGKHFRRQCRRIKNNYGIDISAHCNGCPPLKGKTPPTKLEKFVLWLIDR